MGKRFDVVNDTKLIFNLPAGMKNKLVARAQLDNCISLAEYVRKVLAKEVVA